MKFFTRIKTAVFILLIVPFSTFAQEANLPTDIKNLTGEALDSAVELSWDAATDDGVILGHKIYYDTRSIDDMAEDEYYANETLTESSENSYTLDGLTNGVTYYFAVTALDEEGNESYGYSNELKLTPSSGSVDTPSVISARQISENEIEVVMSKPVVVKSITQAFSVTEKGNMSNELVVENIEVSDTYVYIEVDAGSILSGTTYEVTATSAVEDLDGNPVSSGITDTVSFTANGGDGSGSVDDEPIVDINDDTLFADDDFSDISLDIPGNEGNQDTHQAATDRIAPGDIRGFSMDDSQISSKGIVTLSWQPAIDKDGDITDQILYTKKGNRNWDNGYSLGKTTRSEVISVQKNTVYGVRIVTIDRSGNQSNGVVLNFTTNLSKSGPTAIYIFLGVFVVVLFLFMSGRRRSF